MLQKDEGTFGKELKAFKSGWKEKQGSCQNCPSGSLGFVIRPSHRSLCAPGSIALCAHGQRGWPRLAVRAFPFQGLAGEVTSISESRLKTARENGWPCLDPLSVFSPVHQNVCETRSHCVSVAVGGPSSHSTVSVVGRQTPQRLSRTICYLLPNGCVAATALLNIERGTYISEFWEEESKSLHPQHAVGPRWPSGDW